MTAFERWQNERRAELNETIDSIEDLTKKMLDSLGRPKEQRVINPTQRKFLEDGSPVKVYKGEGGSGKTIIGVIDIILKAMMIPGSKWFIGRRDYNDNLKTTAKTAEGVMSRLPNGILLDKNKTPPMTWWIKPIITSSDPMPQPSTIEFIGLSDWMGGYEYCGGFIDEIDEVDETFFWQLKRAIRYIPSGMPDMEIYPISGAFNPTPKAHWLYKCCMGHEQDGTPYNKGVPTMSMHDAVPGENKLNVRKGYYEEMVDMPHDLQQRYLKNEWMDVFPGAPVIKQFNPLLHVRRTSWKGHTLYRFWDFGYNRPSCHFVQVKTNGYMEVMKEYLGKQIEGTAFIDVVKQITNQNYPDNEGIIDFGDPAVNQHKDTGKMLTLLNAAGINMQFKKVPFDISIALVRQRFSMLIDGEPAVIVDPECLITIAALKGGYRLKDDGVTPHKDGFYDHLMDDLRYGIYNIHGSGLVQVATASEAAKYTNARTVWNNKRH
jgi:hypothetical protein